MEALKIKGQETFGQSFDDQIVRFLPRLSRNSRYPRNSQNQKISLTPTQLSNILEFKRKSEIETKEEIGARSYNPSTGRWIIRPDWFFWW